MAESPTGKNKRAKSKDRATVLIELDLTLCKY